jgi:hypothetical protein
VEKHVLPVECEILRVSRAQELDAHLHELLASVFRARKGIENRFAMLNEQFLALHDTLSVC